MKFLLLNTCGAEGSLALADTGFAEPVVTLARMPGRTASERLVAVLRETMADAGWKLRDVAAIAVVTGPGSFTGVRVGLSVAKGLSEAGGVPIIAVSRLAMLAAGAGKVCSLLDAGRGEFYCGLYGDGVESREALLPLEDAFAAATEADAAVVCEESVAAAFAGVARLRVIGDPTAAEALPFALRRFEAGSFDDPETLDANYLRRTDAEIFAPKTAASKRAAVPPARQAG